MVFKLLTTHHPRRLRHSGITLVEMLISMAVTLVMMAAVVNLFANIGAGVRNRRASMELGTQLRSARARLFKDLAGATCPVRPKLPNDDHDDGYFEIVEGQYSDKNPSALVQFDTIDAPEGGGTPIGLQHATSLVPRDNSGRLVQWEDNNDNGIVDGNAERNSVQQRGSASALGDYDDILALTVRSESEPFKGRMPVWIDPDGPAGSEPFQWRFQTIESDLAEVIWYAVENPADGSNGEPGMRTVYRRVLLIAPWVEELPPQFVPSGSPDAAKQLELDQMYYQLSDISFRRVVRGDDDFIRVPNTLADLTRRENRFGHLPHPYTGDPLTSFPNETNYPHAVDLRAIRVVPGNSRPNFPQNIGAFPFFQPFGTPFEWDPGSFNITSAANDALPNEPPGESPFNAERSRGSDRKGEDVMLNDVLAFDLRVFDPGAPLYDSNGIILEPSDHGWAAEYLRQERPTESNAAFDAMIGQGAYVDLGYVQAVSLDPIPPNPPMGPQPTRPVFDVVPNLKSGLNFSDPLDPIKFIAYDTWPYHYETDGIDQDNAVDGTAGIDQGTNGLDDIVPYDLDNDPTTPPTIPMKDGQPIGLYGPDDPIEREAPPPYDHPLRAMQAKIRVYDRESRQIREATVTRNFVPQ